MNLLYNVFFFAVFGSIHFFVICQNIPNPRCQQTSTLVGTKLYFFGGGTSRYSISNEVWYLDLSNSLNVTTPQWHQDAEMILGYNLGSSCISPIDNSTVFLIGGRTWFPNTINYKYNSSIYIFNSKTSLWTTPSINNFNSSFTGRNGMQAVINSKGKIFIFGGTDYYDNKPISTIYNDMNIFDITTMTWSTQIQPQSLVYLEYTATLLPNGLIIYIGGREGFSVNYVNMNQLRTFDTSSYTWSTQIVSGPIILSRFGHSTVLTQDGKIILYGGSTINATSGFAGNIFSDISVLNTNTWTWSIPSISGINAPPPLTFHSAVLYQTYMIIAFGQKTALPDTYSKNIYILDIQNYAWVASANLPTTSAGIAPTATIIQQNNDNLYIGIGIGVGGFVVIGILFTAGFLIYKKQYKKPKTFGTSIEESIREAHSSVVYSPR